VMRYPRVIRQSSRGAGATGAVTSILFWSVAGPLLAPNWPPPRHDGRMDWIETNDELRPLLKPEMTARELGALVIARAPPRRKFELAMAARDALGRDWSEKTVRHWLTPTPGPCGPGPISRRAPNGRARDEPTPDRAWPIHGLEPTRVQTRSCANRKIQ
jgi:hypothetical protein